MKIILPNQSALECEATIGPSYHAEISVAASNSNKWQKIQVQIDTAANLALCISDKTASKLGINNIIHTEIEAYGGGKIPAYRAFVDLEIEMPNSGPIRFQGVPVAIVPNMPESENLIGTLLLACFQFSIKRGRLNAQIDPQAIMKMMVDKAFEDDFYTNTSG